MKRLPSTYFCVNYFRILCMTGRYTRNWVPRQMLRGHGLRSVVF